MQDLAVGRLDHAQEGLCKTMNSEANEPMQAGLPAHETTYRALRDMVLYGGLAPGEPVTIQGLVARLDAGMTPVREALRRLTSEGALQSLGNRRIMVPELDDAALEELTEARCTLETLLARRACDRVTSADIAELRTIDTRLDAAIERGDVALYLRENHAFHIKLNHIARAPIFAGLVETLWMRFGPSLRIACGQAGTRNLPDRHKDLLVALEKGNTDAAAHAIENDILQGMQLIKAGL